VKADLIAMGFLLAGGGLSGLLFDFYRMLRRQGRWNRAATFCGDLFFSAVVLGVLLFCFRKANFMEFRAYLFIASLAGLALYMVVFSPRVKVFFAHFFSATYRIGDMLMSRGRTVLGAIIIICRLMLAIPYGILRWFGLLIYRFGEFIARCIKASRHARKLNRAQRASRQNGAQKEGEKKKHSERKQKRILKRSQKQLNNDQKRNRKR
jgi:spore cortex biosynthesis protein YabQ